MIEIFGDLFEQYDADAICITTNGSVKKNGEAVMGRGCALEAHERFNLKNKLGNEINQFGNNIHILLNRDFIHYEYNLITFPVKHNWWEKADIKLIEKMALNISKIAFMYNWKKIIIPRPGCGNGGLKWKDVKPILKSILDDRFYIIDRKEEA